MNSSSEDNYKYQLIYHKVGVVTLAITLLCVFLNLTALFAVIKKKKDSSYFVINLFLSSVLTQIIVVLIMLDRLEIIAFYGVWLCGIRSAMLRFGGAILPLTIVGLSYERLKTPGLKSGKFSLAKVLLTTWCFAFVLSIPSYLAYNFVPADGGKPHCRKKPILDSIVAKLLYELAMCILLHILPSIFIIYYLVKMKFRPKYLFVKKSFPIPLKKKLQRVRLVLWYSFSFVLIWTPFGIIKFLKRAFENPTEKVEYRISNTLATVMYFLSMIFLFLHPIIYLWAHNKRLLADLVKICSCSISNRTDKDRLYVINGFITSAVRLETVGDFNCEYSKRETE